MPFKRNVSSFKMYNQRTPSIIEQPSEEERESKNSIETQEIVIERVDSKNETS